MGRYQEGVLSEDERYAEGLSPHIERTRVHHRNMARDMVAGGLTPSQLARIYGFSKGQISRIIGSPAFQAELRRLENGSDVAAMDIRDEVSRMAYVAIDNLKDDLTMDITSDKDRRLRQNASLETLALAGVKKSDRPIGSLVVTDNRTQVNINGLTDEELRERVFKLASGDD